MLLKNHEILFANSKNLSAAWHFFLSKNFAEKSRFLDTTYNNNKLRLTRYFVKFSHEIRFVWTP